MCALAHVCTVYLFCFISEQIHLFHLSQSLIPCTLCTSKCVFEVQKFVWYGNNIVFLHKRHTKLKCNENVKHQDFQTKTSTFGHFKNCSIISKLLFSSYPHAPHSLIHFLQSIWLEITQHRLYSNFILKIISIPTPEDNFNPKLTTPFLFLICCTAIFSSCSDLKYINFIIVNIYIDLLLKTRLCYIQYVTLVPWRKERRRYVRTELTNWDFTWET